MEKNRYMVNIYATEHYENVHGDTIWSKVWTKFFNTIEEADSFIYYQQTEFGRRSTLHEKIANAWKIVSDTRY